MVAFDTVAQLLGSALELLAELFAEGYHGLRSRILMEPRQKARPAGTTFRPRRAMTLTAVDLRHPERAGSFSVSLTKDSRLRVVRQARPAGKELGAMLVGDDSAIPEEHRAIARAYGYELPLTEAKLATQFVELPPGTALNARRPQRLR